MNLNGIVQIVLYLVVLLALVKPLGSFMARVYQGEPCGLDRVLGPLENLIYRACGIRREEEMTLASVCGRSSPVQPCRRAFLVSVATSPGDTAIEPAETGRRFPGFILQYGSQFRHQHQLAGVRRRDDHELPHPDGGTCGAEFRFRCHGHGGAGCPHSGICPAHDADHRQLLGRPDPQHPLHPASSLPGPGTGPRHPREWCRALALTGMYRWCRRSVTTSRGSMPRETPSRMRQARSFSRLLRRGNRPSPWVQRPRRSPSSSSAPTGAAFSTSTPHIPTKTRPPSPISCRCWPFS